MSFAFISIIQSSLIVITLSAQQPVILQSPRVSQIDSPRVTNWGSWFAMETCPPNTVVVGMQLKVESRQGATKDDTALNAIRLRCGIPGVPNSFTEISSGVGNYGEWRGTYVCPGNSYANGFQLRSEPNQGVFVDDTAANNLNLYCSDGTILSGDGDDWGSWTTPQHCPAGMSLCGLQTQIEMTAPVDDTALNNVDMLCC